MSSEPDPPRKHYQLKPKEFEILNAPASAANADATPTHVRGHLRAANDTPAAATPLSPTSTPNDVQALLRANLARADASGLNDLKPKPKRRSRRTRDYWLVVIVVDAFLAYMAFGPRANAVTFIYGVGGLVFFTVGLTWIMWFVMDDY